MQKKRILSILLSLSFIISCFPAGVMSAESESNKRKRTVYLHAQGENVSGTADSTTLYSGDNADIYFAVNDPNMGNYLKPENDGTPDNSILEDVKAKTEVSAAAEADKLGYTGDKKDKYIKEKVAEAVAIARHTEPQFDMNGYTLTVYFDPNYLEYADNSAEPIVYDVPDANFSTSDEGNENVGDDTISAPQEVGYYVRENRKLGQINLGGKNYEAATITVFFSGGFLPQKKDGMDWYNLCKLPLKTKDGRTGSTQVLFDTSGTEGRTLELFAKNNSEELNEQTFKYTAIEGGYHRLLIKDRTRPAEPTASVPEGSYTDVQYVTLKAEDGCDIYYTTDDDTPILYDGQPIKIESTTTITCYAERGTGADKKQSNTVKFTYKILPKAPFLFVEKNSAKELISPSYSETDRFKVYVSDKDVFGDIETDSEVYYTFSDISAENLTEGDDPETEWVKVYKPDPTIEITKKTTVRLITKKYEEYSSVSEYQLGIRPAKPKADKASDTYDAKIDVTLSCDTTGADIYYTLDGSDPITNGFLYDGILTIAKDTTLRCVAKFDVIYSEVESYHYVFTKIDDMGVDAFYPSGVYEGNVNVTLTPNDPNNDIKYSTDGVTWVDYDKTLLIDKDTDILAKAGKDGVWGDEYKFTYKIKPLPPQFAPESSQFTNASKISVYCVESTRDNTDRFELFYTLDGSEPTTSNTRIQAEPNLDSADIDITKYTVVKAVVLKDGKTYSSVVTNSYDIVNKKPTKPLVTLTPGNYIRKIGDDKGFETKFLPVVGGTETYYTIKYDGSFTADPIPNTSGTEKYEREPDEKPIEVKGRTVIKAVAVNVFGVKSDVGIFEYTVTPEAPKAAPSATINSDKLPIVPVQAVKGSTVKYDLNGFKNEFVTDSGSFFIDTQTGNAYKDRECTDLLGVSNSASIASPAKLTIKSVLDGVESYENVYIYKLSDDPKTLARPYADKETGEYEEVKVDNDNNILHIRLYSLNSGDTIQYKLNNSQNWVDYDENPIKIKNDTILQIRSTKNGEYSASQSYVYNFVPLAPIITLSSGRYLLSDDPQTEIKYDSRAPQDKIDNDYRIWYRENGESQDFPYSFPRDIDHTMSFKAYVKNSDTGRVSKNTIHYYIIESESSAKGSVYVANPYDVTRISAAVLSTGDYAKGIKLLTQNQNADIYYYYSYTLKGSDDIIVTNYMKYDNIPITVNPSMTSIEITAHLEDANGRIEKSDFTHKIDFIHLEIPKTSLGNSQVEFPQGTSYTLINDYPNDENTLMYYTLDGSDPTDESNANRLLYSGENLTLNGAVTVKAVYMSACGKCGECKNDNQAMCIDRVYGAVGEYKYTTPTVINSGSSGGGGGGRGNGGSTANNSRKYTKDIFGVEHPTHISYINGYPDGSVKPEGKITREEMTSILYRITNHAYEKPFIETGDAFTDVTTDRWSAHDIEYMADKEIVLGYPDGEFKPQNNLTRAEFAALICRFAELNDAGEENPFGDLEESHWAYENILALVKSGLVEGYEDGTFRPENEITRAEVMTVVNKLLGRNPSETYVMSLEFNPYIDLEKDKWFYTDVLEATITHDYYLNDKGLEIRWENCK